MMTMPIVPSLSSQLNCIDSIHTWTPIILEALYYIFEVQRRAEANKTNGTESIFYIIKIIFVNARTPPNFVGHKRK